MSNITEDQKIAFNSFKRYIEKGWLAEARKKNPEFARKIEAATADQIHFGKPPSFSKGYIYGNATASGKQSTESTEYTRTINMDLTTDEYTFLANNNAAEKSTCKAACKYLDYLGDNYKNINDKYHLFESYARSQCRENLSRLNFTMSEFRVNESKYVQTQPAFTCNFYPIYLDMVKDNGNEDKYLIGYYDTDKELIYYELKIPMTAKNKLITAGIITAAAIVLGLILFL